MAFVPVPNIAEVFVEHSFMLKPGVGWVLHYESTITPWTPVILLDLCGALRDWWNTHIKPLVTADVALTRIRARDISTLNSPIAELPVTPFISGTRTGASQPPNVAFSVKFNTGLSGRSFRGRKYMFGMNEADVAGKTLTSALADSYVAAWTEALFLTGSDADFGLVIASKYSNNAPRPVGVATDVITVSYADLQVDTQRSRL